MLYEKRIKELRIEKNVTQEEVARFLEIERGTYSQYETENVIIPTKHLNNLCNFFGVSFDYVLNMTDLKNYNYVTKDIEQKNSGIHLKIIRKENKITQKKLAEVLNTAQPVITNYENGKHLISVPFLYTICKKYKVSADYILGRTNSPKYIK